MAITYPIEDAPIKGYRSKDGATVQFRVDGPTYAMQCIDYGHHEIHAQSHFFYAHTAVLGSGGIQNYLITTPNTTKWAHTIFHAELSAIGGFNLFEATDMVGTTPALTYNSDRNAAGTATVVIHTDASGTVGGTNIWPYWNGATSRQSRSSSENRNEDEIILKQNTKYCFQVVSGVANNLSSFRVTWYEHTNAL